MREVGEERDRKRDAACRGETHIEASSRRYTRFMYGYVRTLYLLVSRADE